MRVFELAKELNVPSKDILDLVNVPVRKTASVNGLGKKAFFPRAVIGFKFIGQVSHIAVFNKRSKHGLFIKDAINIRKDGCLGSSNDLLNRRSMFFGRIVRFMFCMLTHALQ